LQNSHVKFVKIDVDKQAELARRFRVTAMPTFKFLKGGKEVAEVSSESISDDIELTTSFAEPTAAASSAS
jgi:thioredoxin-like negative regulator of GroEL